LWIRFKLEKEGVLKKKWKRREEKRGKKEAKDE